MNTAGQSQHQSPLRYRSLSGPKARVYAASAGSFYAGRTPCNARTNAAESAAFAANCGSPRENTDALRSLPPVSAGYACECSATKCAPISTIATRKECSETCSARRATPAWGCSAMTPTASPGPLCTWTGGQDYTMGKLPARAISPEKTPRLMQSAVHEPGN